MRRSSVSELVGVLERGGRVFDNSRDLHGPGILHDGDGPRRVPVIEHRHFRSAGGRQLDRRRGPSPPNGRVMVKEFPLLATTVIGTSNVSGTWIVESPATTAPTLPLASTGAIPSMSVGSPTALVASCTVSKDSIALTAWPALTRSVVGSAAEAPVRGDAATTTARANAATTLSADDGRFVGFLYFESNGGDACTRKHSETATPEVIFPSTSRFSWEGTPVCLGGQ